MKPGIPTTDSSLDVSEIFTDICALARERRSAACEGASLWISTRPKSVQMNLVHCRGYSNTDIRRSCPLHDAAAYKTVKVCFNPGVPFIHWHVTWQ